MKKGTYLVLFIFTCVLPIVASSALVVAVCSGFFSNYVLAKSAPVSAIKDRTLDLITFESEFGKVCIAPVDLKPGDFYRCDQAITVQTVRSCRSAGGDEVKDCNVIRMEAVSKGEHPKLSFNEWEDDIKQLYQANAIEIRNVIVTKYRQVEVSEEELDIRVDLFLNNLGLDSTDNSRIREAYPVSAPSIPSMSALTEYYEISLGQPIQISGQHEVSFVSEFGGYFEHIAKLDLGNGAQVKDETSMFLDKQLQFILTSTVTIINTRYDVSGVWDTQVSTEVIGDKRGRLLSAGLVEVY